MKKYSKTGIWLLAIVLIASVLMLVACNAPDNVDKASKNEQFVSFRKKIVTILKDNDIFVNDLDSTSAKAVANASTVATVKSLYSNANTNGVGDLLVNDSYSVDSENYVFGLKQIYSIALRMSLCLGDGLINYFNETEIYNIPVFIPELNMVLTQRDNVISIYSYQLQEGREYLMKIDIVFNGDKEYYFTVTETGGAWIVDGSDSDMYFYGDSNKVFLMFNPGSEAVYTPNGADFYRTDDKDVLDGCLSVLGKDIFDLNAADYRKIKDNVKHTFTQAQFEALSDKYFKDVQSSTQNRPSEFEYENINGKNVLKSYYAAEGETEVVIPNSVKYISEQFYIQDVQGSVTSLKLPSSVAEIVDADGKASVDPNCVRIMLAGQNGEKLLQNITVAQGSPLFKSGSGHLTSKDGTVIYALDKTSDKLDLNVLMCALRQSETGVQYKNIYKITSSTADINSGDIAQIAERYGYGEREVIEQLQRALNASAVTVYNVTVSCSDVVNGSGKNDGNAFASLRFAVNLKSNVTVNVNYGQGDSNADLDLGVLFANNSASKFNVTVNVTGFTYRTSLEVGPTQPTVNKGEEAQYVSNDNIFTAFKLDVPKFYFDGLCKGRITRDERNSQIGFDKSKDEQYRNLVISDANTNSAHSELYCVLDVTNDVRNGDVIDIPSKLFGLGVQIVRIDVDAVANKQVKVVLNGIGINFGHLEFYSSSNDQTVTLDNADFVIASDCDLEMLKSHITNYDSTNGYSISCALQANGKTELYQTGWEYGSGSSDNDVKRAWLQIDGQDVEINYSKQKGVILLENCEQDVAYFVVPMEYVYGSSWYEHSPIDTYVDDKGQLRCDYDDVCEDVTYTLVKHSLGVQKITARWDQHDYSFNVNVSFSANTIDGKTYFEAVVGNMSLGVGGSSANATTYTFNEITDVKANKWYTWNFIKKSVIKDLHATDASSDGFVTYEDNGGVDIRIVCLDGELLICYGESYVEVETTIYIGYKTVTQTVKNTIGGHFVKVNADDWNLDDIDNYLYYAVSRRTMEQFYSIFSEILLVEEDGSVYAYFQGDVPRYFHLKRVPLGQSQMKYKSGAIDFVVDINAVKPEIKVYDNGTKYIEFNRSTIEVSGTVYDREIYGSHYVPMPSLQYMDVEWSECKIRWEFDYELDLKINNYRLSDPYVTIQINVGNKTYDKHVIKGEQMSINPEWLDLDADNYAYFWLTDDGRTFDVFANENGTVYLNMPKDDVSNPAFQSMTLVRLAYDTPTAFHIQDDDGQGNLYDLDITLTVTLDNSHAAPYNKVTVTASGRYNEGTIQGASSSSSLYSVSFTWDNGMSTTPRKWLMEINGLDLSIVGLGERLY